MQPIEPGRNPKTFPFRADLRLRPSKPARDFCIAGRAQGLHLIIPPRTTRVEPWNPADLPLLEHSGHRAFKSQLQFGIGHLSQEIEFGPRPFPPGLALPGRWWDSQAPPPQGN